MDQIFQDLCLQAQAQETKIAKQVSRQLTHAIQCGERNLKTLETLMEPLWDTLIGLSGTGTATYRRYLRYVQTIDPKEAEALLDHFEDMLGYKLWAVYAAADIAHTWHAGQTDKAGKDYFKGHLTTVAHNCHHWKNKVVGFLHDTAEDTDHTVDEIIAALKQRLANLRKHSDLRATYIDRYSPYIDTCPNDVCHPLTTKDYAEIAEALYLLNHHTAPNRQAYIERFRGHDLAIKVKLADMQHNMDLSRLPAPTQRDLDRQSRYQKEYAQLLAMMNELYPLP